MNKSVAKKMFLVLLMILFLFLVSGCSFSDLMSWGTGVSKDPDYMTWEKLSEQGKLDEEGRFTAETVRVSFAKNSFLDIKYYRDAELKNEIADDVCTLVPGDIIYSTVNIKSNAESIYVFDHFDIVEYSDEDVRGKTLDWNYGDEGTAILIPFDYKGTEVAVEPVGHLKMITVRLEQPGAGGQITYSVGGQELTGETADLYCGARIKGVFHADAGWDSTLGEQQYYTVTDQPDQTVVFNGVSANKIFSEQDAHKPALTLELNGNLRSCLTAVEADGFTVSNLQASSGTPVKDQKIGTGSGLVFSFKRADDLSKGNNAVQISVTKKTPNTEYREIHYATEEQNAVRIRFERDIDYLSVFVKVEAVNAAAFAPVKDESADIIARFNDLELDDLNDQAVLTAGTLSTPRRTMMLEIIPRPGYEIAGSFVSDGKYARQIWFSEYDQVVKEVLSNQLKKKCRLILVTDDPYGTVEYKIDGNIVSGEIEVLEGKDILISYTLKNDAEYEITETRNIFDQLNVFDGDRFKRYEKSFKVERKLDGKTITREDLINGREKVKK